MKLNIDRRDVVQTAGLGALASLLSGTAMAMPVSERGKSQSYEKENEALVSQFCLDWADQDAEKLITYLDEKIEYHMWEGGPTINGHEQFRKQMTAFLTSLKEVRWDIHRSHTMGDIVINERTDYFVKQDGTNNPGSPYHVLGVFLVRDQKIVYWKDYSLSMAEKL